MVKLPTDGDRPHESTHRGFIRVLAGASFAGMPSGNTSQFAGGKPKVGNEPPPLRDFKWEVEMKQRDKEPLAPIVVETIREEVEARKWDVDEFARHACCSPRLAQSILDGTSGWTRLMPFRLASAFGTSSEVWMNLQKLEAN